MKTFRLVVCVDIEADTLKDAYKKLRGHLRDMPLGWETSDEWYDHNSDDPGDPQELQTAIVEVLEKE